MQQGALSLSLFYLQLTQHAEIAERTAHTFITAVTAESLAAFLNLRSHIRRTLVELFPRNTNYMS